MIARSSGSDLVGDESRRTATLANDPSKQMHGYNANKADKMFRHLLLHAAGQVHCETMHLLATQHTCICADVTC